MRYLIPLLDFATLMSLTVAAGAGEPGTAGSFWVHTHDNVYPNDASPCTLMVQGDTVATAPRSWSAVKNLYR